MSLDPVTLPQYMIAVIMSENNSPVFVKFLLARFCILSCSLLSPWLGTHDLINVIGHVVSDNSYLYEHEGCTLLHTSRLE